jgi:predicted DNA-binding protein with PD1-like motif
MTKVGGVSVKSFSLEGQRVLLGRLDKGDDVLSGLTEFCVEHGVAAGVIHALGAVQRGGVGFYDQAAGEYVEVRFQREMEIASLVGNISRKQGETFLHCHVILADREGHCFGGHLLEGNVAFACEFAVTALEGPVPERTHDEATGLMLW